MYAPIVFVRTAVLEPITRDDFIDEPSDDDRRATQSTPAADLNCSRRRARGTTA